MSHHELHPKCAIHLKYKEVCYVVLYYLNDVLTPPRPSKKKITTHTHNKTWLLWTRSMCVNSVTVNQCPFRVMVHDVRGVTA